jgi:glycosyltransferase involved in cell wall biosynthesis
MILGIDASNIRAGGGVTHLVELLRAVDPHMHGFSQVVIWSGLTTLNKIEEREWLQKNHNPLFESGLPYRLFWQKFKLKSLAQKAGCSILFVPGGSDASNFQPLVTISQNMLPFEWAELQRFGWSLMTLKLMLLRSTQGRTFCKANGIVFLTQYARNGVQEVTGQLVGETTNIPHGINHNFFCSPRHQRDLTEFTIEHPCRLIYVSIIDVYKHQWQVIKAVGQLQAAGIPIILDLVGPPGMAIERLEETVQQVDPTRTFIKYHGAVNYDLLPEFYKSADIGIFASSCENMPNILLESMAAGLPIACSDLGPMPEMLGEAGVYFHPEQPEEIAAAILKLIDSRELRAELAELAFQQARSYSWERCARETFDFLAKVAMKNSKSSVL